jgi:hypothetical protein
MPGGLTHAFSNAPGLYTRWSFVSDASGLYTWWSYTCSSLLFLMPRGFIHGGLTHVHHFYF